MNMDEWKGILWQIAGFYGNQIPVWIKSRVNLSVGNCDPLCVAFFIVSF